MRPEVRGTFASAAVVLGLLLAACAESEPPLPDTVQLYAEPPLAEQALAFAGQLLAPRGLRAEPAAGAPEADLAVGAAPTADSVPFPVRYWVPVVQLPHPARELSMVQLGDAVAGRLDDWSAITGEDVPLRVVVPLDPAPPLEQWWPGLDPVVTPLPLEQILAVLFVDPGAMALLPLDLVGASVRSLAVDGINVVFGRGNVSSYPLVEQAWVAPRDAEGEEFAQLLREAARGLAERLSVSPPEPIILRATGDILPVRCAYAKQLAYGDFRHAFLELGPWLAEADITVGSLDAALSDAGEPFGCVATFSLLAPAASVEGLAYAGFDVITVATNHVKDCGQSACGDRAFFDTLENLRANGIQPVGGGADLAEARAPAIVTVRGVRFAFLGYDEIAPYYHAAAGAPGTAPLEEAYVREDVAAVAAGADVVVVLPQWGVEYTADPTLNQRALARAAVEAGAVLVIGNHPHWVQAAEVIDGAFVAYALGNFVFDQDWSVATQQGAVLEVAFHPDGQGGAQLKGIEYYPVHIRDEHQPVFAEPAEAQQILDRIWTASAALH